MPNKWDNTNMFIFEPWQIHGGNIDQMIQEAKHYGFTGVLLKFANGSLAGDPVSQRFMDTFKQYAPSFKAKGFTVGGWIYQYLTDVTGEVDACVEAVQAGAEWLVLDGEVEIKDKAAEVKQFGQLLRKQLPDIEIGYSSFGVPQYHPGPYQEYAAFCNVMMPQIYWGDFGWSVERAFNMSMEGFKPYGLPIAPTGQAYDSVTHDEMQTFAKMAHDAGITGVSWWDWQHASQQQLAATHNDFFK